LTSSKARRINALDVPMTRKDNRCHAASPFRAGAADITGPIQDAVTAFERKRCFQATALNGCDAT
jgi:hypothetical protein